MASKVASQGLKQVKPVLSLDRGEARRRVFALYKAWSRHIPLIVRDYDIPVTANMGRQKLREEFDKNRHVTDIRVIDLLVVKGQQELVEATHIWKQRVHVMKFFKDTENPRPADFLSRFYDGKDD